MSAIALDPLIADAQHRARRRRFLALIALVAVAAAVAGTTYSFRSSGNAAGICASAPSGWMQKTVNDPRLGRPAIVLTNFRFGRMNDLYGLTDRFDWPANGVTVAVINQGRRNVPNLKNGALRFTRSEFGGLEGSTQPSGFIEVPSQGLVLDAYVEVGKLTPATIALANTALAGVRTCSA